MIKRNIETVTGGKSGRTLTVWVVNQGNQCACYGALRERDGKTPVATTRDFPYGFDGEAREAARALAAKY
jgi:hypothetical protein